jgi:hypothetical protein
MKKLILLTATICIFGCGRQAKELRSTDNPRINVELLFEHEGVKVYRFYDGLDTLYYTDARGSVEWIEYRGKTSVKRRVETVEEETK